LNTLRAPSNQSSNHRTSVRECAASAGLSCSDEVDAQTKGIEIMKYMLMMNTMTAGEIYAGVSGWQNQDIQAHTVFLKSLSNSLRDSGELVCTEGLSLPDQARIVRAGKGGEPVTDGIFPEGKEFLAGYWIVDVEAPQRAYEIAARASTAPGPGGTPLNMPIEVRPVMSCAPAKML
jgi:hypothetical protein